MRTRCHPTRKPTLQFEASGYSEGAGRALGSGSGGGKEEDAPHYLETVLICILSQEPARRALGGLSPNLPCQVLAGRLSFPCVLPVPCPSAPSARDHTGVAPLLWEDTGCTSCPPLHADWGARLPCEAQAQRVACSWVTGAQSEAVQAKGFKAPTVATPAAPPRRPSDLHLCPE